MPTTGESGYVSVSPEGGYRRVELVMGTMIGLHIADPLPAARRHELAEACYAWLREVDDRFSTYRHDSEVNRLDRGELHPDACSPDLRGVLSACADLWQETDGYFDVYATGRLDPSGYVKGWAAEVASARLAAAGSTNHCLNAGGDVRTRGNPAPGVPWHIPVTHPWQTDGAYLVLAATDLAIATSGTYQRGCHVVDPHTGEAAGVLRSVTVTGPDLGRADAYATTAVAMGLDGLTWLTRLPPGYHATAVTEDGRGYSTPGLPAVDPTTPAPAQRPTGR